MQRVIEIVEEEYRAISINKGVPYDLSPSIGNAILNGKPLDAVFDEIRRKIEPKCDRINTLAASELSYPEHREIQELLREIMDLYKKESEA